GEPRPPVARELGVQPLSVVEEEELSPEVDEALGRGRAGEGPYPGDGLRELVRDLPAGGVSVLEQRALVDDEGPVAAAVLQGVGEILDTDDVDVRVGGQLLRPSCRATLGHA